MLSKEEITRYSKQLLLPEFGKKAQEKLKRASILVIGAGGLGCPVLQYLAAAGSGRIGIVDFDVVDETNLQRQLLYTVNDLGKSKARVALEKISLLNPYVQPEIINTKLETHNAFELISGYDVVVDCSDNFETRYVINDACVLLNKPFVYGGIHKFEGQLSVFNYKNSDGIPGPTYRCAFPEIHNETVLLNCSLTGVIGTLPGIIGTLQANEVIKMITGIGKICAGEILILNALTLTFAKIKISRNEKSWNDFPASKEEFLQKNYFQLSTV
jgi:molybdopterin/thiamine biosynthesis adenylyltransferase